MIVEDLKMKEIIKCLSHKKSFKSVKDLLKHLNKNKSCYVLYSEVKEEVKK